MSRAIVVGSGAGGAMAARELQGGFDVTLLEAGRGFRPFLTKLSSIERLKPTGLLFDEREIQVMFPAMRVRKTEDRIVLINGRGLGGTTTIATGNGVRCDDALRSIGINLDKEFEELDREIPISAGHQARWRESTKRLYDLCRTMGLRPRPSPKMGDSARCKNCGHCVLGCPFDAKWDARKLVEEASGRGARVVEGAKVRRVRIKDGKALGVEVRIRGVVRFIPADLIVLAAGGLGTPLILEESGIACEQKLFVDPVLCVATTWKGALQNREISMPFIVQQHGYILAPYFDYLSFFFNKDWKFAADDTLSMMIKIADTNTGSISKGGIRKTLSDQDRGRLIEGVSVCYELFERIGANSRNHFLGTVNAGHPGGMLPLTKEDASTLHSNALPCNMYVADSSLFPSSPGNPPIFTIMALAKRISKLCLQQAA